MKLLKKNRNKQFDEQELLTILSELISKKSDFPNDTEEAVAKYVQNILKENGIEARLDYVTEGRPNVIAELKGKYRGKTLLYNGHLDVVPATGNWNTPPFKAVQHDGKIYGRGASDMKSGVAAMLYATIVLKRMGAPFAGKLILFFNVDEERENAGMHHFLKSEVTADYAVISEPTELAIHVAHKGIARLRIRTFGKAKHAGNVSKRESNAIVHMMKIIYALERFHEQLLTRDDELLGNASLTVTKIDGGTAINIVPDYCEIEVDRRVLHGEKEDEIIQEITAIVQRVAREGQFSVEIEPYLFIPATKIDPDTSFVKKLSTTIEHITGQHAHIGIFAASCEAPFLSVYKQIPTIICGPGSLEQAHRINEYVEVSEVIQASKIFIELVQHLLDEK